MPDSDTWNAICEICGDIFHYDKETQTPRRVFVHKNLTIHQVCCEACVDKVPCSANINGIHGEVIDLVEWAAGGVGAIPTDSVPDGWDLHKCQLPLTQLGFCRACYLWMRWDVPTQRWRDLRTIEVENRYLTPRQLLRQTTATLFHQTA